METIYPAGPTDLPATFTRPSAAYRRHAWIAVGSLLLFILLYVALAGWFILTGINELARAGSDDGLLQFVAGVSSFFLAFFMLKALFFIKKGAGSGGIELKRTEQPRLFAFLDRIADDAGAPRPHKIFITARVNAAVYYDLSLLNLLFPSRKNLEIGLGLVNMLNLSEFKAVLAHEFGHFGQRSMAVGRWVYTTQQIAAHIVAKRDALDRFLRQLSRLDIRIAWIGWLLSVVVWALRSVVDAVFRLVLIAQRALSRDMEMQADLVAVSLTGSDAIVQALHRLQAADDAWERTQNFLRGEAAAGHPPRNAFDVQKAIAERLPLIYNDARYGDRPQVPAEGGAAFRVFSGELAQPPRMWSTHPMNHEREQNAKRTYVFVTADERPAWLVFDDATGLRERMTRELLGNPEQAAAEPTLTLQRIDEQFAREHLKPEYRGLYLGFSPVRHANRANELHGHALITQPLLAEDLYPGRLVDELSQLRSLEREHALLCSLRDRVYDAPDGVIRHRGKIIKRSELPKAIAMVDGERSAARAGLEADLKRIRSLHQAAAAKVSPAWEAHLRGLLALLHYAEHSEANLRDAHASLARWWQRSVAGGSINEQGVRYIMAAAGDVHRALAQVFSAAGQVQPGAAVLARLGGESWSKSLGGLGLNAPSRDNINDWLRIVDRWVSHAAGHLSALRRATLDELLQTEATIAAATRGIAPPDAPSDAISVPDAYDVILVGKERGQHAEKPGFWERFRTANGFFPALARGAVALAIVGSVLVFGWSIGRITVTVYNGLARPVVASVGDQQVTLEPGSHADLTVPSQGDVAVNTRARDGEPIEAFSAPVERGTSRIVYTVAAASPLRHWTAAYGSARPSQAQMSAPQRWQAVNAEYIFTRPPDRIQTKDGGAIKTVIDAPDDLPPEVVADQVQDKNAANAMLLAHVRFDAPDSPYLLNWLASAKNVPGFDVVFAARRKQFPLDVIAMRLEQDIARAAGSAEVCARDRASAAASPEQAELAYLAIRCMPASKERDERFVEGRRHWPDSPWFANAAASVAGEHGQYQDALADYELAMSKSPALRQLAAEEAFRLVRLVDPTNARDKALAYVGASPSLGGILQFERGTATADGPYRAIAMLSNGQLDAAVDAASSTPMAARVLRLAAASTGASPALRRRVAQLPHDQGIDRNTVWLALANGEDPASPAVAEVLATVEKEYDAPEAVAKVENFLAMIRHGDTKEAEAQLDGVPLELRAYAYVGGSYILGDRTPAAWRNYARSVLYAVERPYMG